MRKTKSLDQSFLPSRAELTATNSPTQAEDDGPAEITCCTEKTFPPQSMPAGAGSRGAQVNPLDHHRTRRAGWTLVINRPRRLLSPHRRRRASRSPQGVRSSRPAAVIDLDELGRHSKASPSRHAGAKGVTDGKPRSSRKPAKKGHQPRVRRSKTDRRAPD